MLQYWDWTMGGMHGDDSGPYVLRGDFEEVLRQLAEVIEQRERIREDLVFAKAIIYDLKKQVAK